jgi:flagellin
MDAATLKVNALKISDTASITAVDEAIQTVSKFRSDLGAVQNRLEHTINNLDNVVENTTSAEAQIRDTDMAKEMVKFSNNNILTQAGTAMLAQANQANQGVLSLLQ